jgi:hypothetical protein
MLVNIMPCRPSAYNGWPRSLEKGIKACGDQVTISDDINPGADVQAFWGLKRRPGKVALARGYDCLIIERAYLGNRHKWRAMGWNGLNGWADFKNHDVEPDRWDKYWREGLKPWKKGGDYALIIGQVPGDAALRGLDIYQWAAEVAEEAHRYYPSVKFRNHPDVASRGWGIPNADLQEGTLEQAFAECAVVITYNSNTAVEAVYNGVPAVSMDGGSMAWDVTTHDLSEPLYREDRHDWGRRIAYSQWLPNEIESGEAWRHLSS